MKRKIFIYDYELVSKRRDWIDALLLFETNERSANGPPPETNIWLVDCLYEIMSNSVDWLNLTNEYYSNEICSLSIF
jgi:hypothetical protein